MKINEVEPIETGGVKFDQKSKASEIFEKPLVKAAIILFEKNIETNFSSANRKDIASVAYITFPIQSLSKENQDTLNNFNHVVIRDHGSIPKQSIKVTYDVSKDTDASEVEEYFLSVAESLEYQNPEWMLLNISDYIGSPMTVDANAWKEWAQQGLYFVDEARYVTSKEVLEKIEEYNANIDT